MATGWGSVKWLLRLIHRNQKSILFISNFRTDLITLVFVTSQGIVFFTRTVEDNEAPDCATFHSYFPARRKEMEFYFKYAQAGSYFEML